MMKTHAVLQGKYLKSVTRDDVNGWSDLASFSTPAAAVAWIDGMEKSGEPMMPRDHYRIIEVTAKLAEVQP